MKNQKSYLTFLVAVFFLCAVKINAQDTTSTKTKEINKNITHDRMFVDENGDGYNDNAPDHDGDGIPNGLDPDYLKIKKIKKMQNLPYVDLNGDGINDNLQFKKGGEGFGSNKRNVVLPQEGTTPGNGSGTGSGQKNRKGNGGKK